MILIPAWALVRGHRILLGRGDGAHLVAAQRWEGSKVMLSLLRPPDTLASTAVPQRFLLPADALVELDDPYLGGGDVALPSRTDPFEMYAEVLRKPLRKPRPRR